MSEVIMDEILQIMDITLNETVVETSYHITRIITSEHTEILSAANLRTISSWRRQV